MTSTSLDSQSIIPDRGASNGSHDKNPQLKNLPLSTVNDDEAGTVLAEEGDSLKPAHDRTARRLKPRHIQLIGIGGYVE